MIRYEFFNDKGKALADRIAAALRYDDANDAIIYIGALGICVRKIKDIICDKYTDPAVICVDSTGKWVIPVLSGHVGGANELARAIAAITGGEAVITTQSDNAGLWALDTMASKYGWGQAPLSHDVMNALIASFVNGEPTIVLMEAEDEGTAEMEQSLPAHVTICRDREEYLELCHTKDYAVRIIISCRTDIEEGRSDVLRFFPQQLHLGIGCQRDIDERAADQLLQEVTARGFAPEAIASVGTIALKQDEPMLHRLCQLLPWAECRIYEASELATVHVPNPSDKVYEVTGCYGVAEASAMMDGRLKVEKQKGCFEGGQHYTWALSGKGGHIEIVGAGPGDPDLVSVRGRKFLERADLILYAGSLVPRELTFCAKPGATVRSSADMDLEEQFAVMKEFYDRDKLVVRLHTGDPCIYGAIQEQMAFFDEYGMDYHITPGISSFLAAAAELRSQFTIPERCQTIILTRGEGRTPMPDKEKLHMLAEHQSTMCIFLSASLAQQVQDELLAGGYPPETPVAACHKLTWKEQRIYRGQLKDLVNIMTENKLTLTTMIVVGDAIDNRQGLSKLYDGHFTHMFRKGKA